MPALTRRETLTALSSLALLGLLPPWMSKAFAADPTATPENALLEMSAPEPFSFDLVKKQAADLATKPWVDPRSPYSAILEQIDYDAFQKIIWKRDHSLFINDGEADPVQLFHLGRYFQEPCTISLVEGDQSRRIVYRKDYFDMPDDHVARQLPDNIGYSGFRVMSQDQTTDWLAFLGAAYFRASGALDQYGLSARAIAIDTAMPTPEEFPRFTAFWLEASPDEKERVIINALVDGPSISGALRMDCTKSDRVVMDIECALYPRKPIARLGVAPLTSMFWFDELNHRQSLDWRPEIHDSDGLALWTGTGERLWRPLNNPPRVMTNSYIDENPKGFGLLQRDRDFDHYQDDGVWYDKRPTVWVEPLGDWGKGSVQLVEIPTDDEIHDNIVLYWVPEGNVAPGRELNYKYRLHWVKDEPYPSPLGRVAESFFGVGGNPGQPRPANTTKFVVDFTGDKLDGLTRKDLDAVVTVSRGTVANTAAYPIVGRKNAIRATFDVVAEGSDPLDIRMYVRRGADAMTETWTSQFFPPAPPL